MDLTRKSRGNQDFGTILDRFLAPKSVQNLSKLDLGCAIMDLTRKSRANQAQRTNFGLQICPKSNPNGRSGVFWVRNGSFCRTPGTLFGVPSRTDFFQPEGLLVAPRPSELFSSKCMYTGTYRLQTYTYRCVHIHTHSNLTTRSPQHVMIRRREQQVNRWIERWIDK